MKQIELGNRIAQQRKHKGMTQEELSIQCNITTRSIQRIEAGEVWPRSFTLKKISEALNLVFEDLEVTKNNSETLMPTKLKTKTSKFLFSISTENIIKIAILSASLNLLFAFAEVVISYIQDKHYSPSNIISLMSVFVYFASFLSCIIYLYGLFAIGKLNRNFFLLTGSLLFMLIMIIVKGDDIILASNSFLKSYLNYEIRYIMFGSAILVNGIGFLFLRNKYGSTVILAGALDCLNGLFFILEVPFPFGLIALSIARIAEIMIMYQIYKKIINEKDLDY
jgi:transcriptional regulator with XRE-family HTH domain